MRVALVMVGVSLLGVAWIAGTQQFGAPDEASHYLRALSITNGRILGPKVRYTDFPLTPAEEVWANHNTRAVMVPARLTPPNVRCMNGKPDLNGRCLVEDVSGNYPPMSYLLPAVGLSVSPNTSTAIWVVRAASALPSLALLILAVALAWDGTGWSVLGLLAATTPMVFFSSSILNPSGMQITACLAFAAALIRISRAPAEAPRWAWLAFGASGALAILAGPIGLEFVILELALFGVLLGRAGVRELRGTTGRWTLRVSALTLMAAAVLALIYSRVAGFEATFEMSPLLPSLREGITQLPPVLKGGVGIFGALTVFLPLAAYWIWWAGVVSLVAAAIWLGDRRARLVTVGVGVLALAFPVFFYAWVSRSTGFGLQGREVLPPLLLIPLVAGEVVSRRSSIIAQRRSARLALGGALAVLAVFLGYAWWYDARAVAGAPHTIRFYAHAIWTPPIGWLPWVALAALGTLALLAFASTEALAAVRLAAARGTPGRGGAVVV
ncbi:MAG: DUF2142 domain-containing protein [Solirubrobacterales bacterium]|nr:DUF2142 domain-containing protein [Solirubrobacterales bacterium]